jgi:hypothetical protein
MIPISFLLVFVTALLHNIKWTQRISLHVGLSFLLSLLALYWTAVNDSYSFLRNILISLAWWRCIANFVTKKWPQVLPLPKYIIKGGPLGEGCAKLCDIIVGLVLWYFCTSDQQSQTLMGRFPPYLSFGPAPSPWLWLLVLIFSLAVNLVLKLWSHVAQSRGSHAGVQSMVEGSLGRALTFREHVELWALAAVNALCEEIASRVLWRSAFAATLLPAVTLYTNMPPDITTTNSTVSLYSNLGQAAVFGIWHYHGIPSGLTGVGLTFVYGYTMGLLFDVAGGSLWIPLVAHTVADYYIFAVLVRQKALKKRSQ